MSDFVDVNGSILDRERYLHDVELLGRVIGADMRRYLETLGFTTSLKAKKDALHCHFVFYNHLLDLEIEVMLKKKSPEAFV